MLASLLSFRAPARLRLLSLAALALLPASYAAETDSAPPSTLAPVTVLGRAADLLGTAEAASQGSVGYLELATRPFLRRGELLEVIPGVVITQHSGGGKANQYFLRGFNLDHGTDFSISVDGLPVNMRSHAHGQGYADLNFIIPEFVQSVDYTKGPFAAEVGDFSAAGAARFTLFKTLPANFATLELGENNFARFVVGTTNGAVTNAQGQYRLVIPNVTAEFRTEIRARTIGYAQMTKAANLVPDQVVKVDFALAQSSLQLDQVVVTGSGQATEVKKLGNDKSSCPSKWHLRHIVAIDPPG